MSKWVALPIRQFGVSLFDLEPGTRLLVGKLHGRAYYELKRRDYRRMCFWAKQLSAEEPYDNGAKITMVMVDEAPGMPEWLEEKRKEFDGDDSFKKFYMGEFEEDNE